MNMATKKDIIEEYLKEYLRTPAERKSEILNTISEVTKLHQKSVVRSFRRPPLKSPGQIEQRSRPTY